jgi:anti-sigma-K factor RskA
MTHETMELHAAAYALGALDGDDLVEFERHLAAGCARCETFLRDSGQALAAAHAAAPGGTPPTTVRAALMARAAAQSRPAARVRRRRTWTGMLAPVAAMVVGALAATLYVAGRYERLRDRLAEETDAVRRVVDLLREPGTRVVTLEGAGPAPQAHARVVWHDTNGGQIVVSGLPAAPHGKAYELWTIRGGTPSPAGVFSVDEAGRAIVRIAPASAGVDVFAVTLEPAQGVPAPTGPIVLASPR